MSDYHSGRIATRGPFISGCTHTIELGPIGSFSRVLPNDFPSYAAQGAAELQHKANARRLVACWNALQRYATEQIEQGDQQRLIDQLCKALEDARNELLEYAHEENAATLACIEAADAVLARAKSKRGDE